MPPRLFSLAIILFWTTMTGWLLYREVWPQFRAGEPPPYSIDLTEEVGANMVSWALLQKEEQVGVGYSQVARLPDRTFELRSQFRFDLSKLKLPVFGKDSPLKLKKIAGVYHVDEAGRLLGLSSTFIVGETSDKGVVLDIELEVRGEVQDGLLELDKMSLGGVEHPIPDWAKAQIPVRGSIFNPMQLLNRVPGLRVGQHWRLPLLEPLGGQLSALSAVIPRSLAMPELEATVDAAVLSWCEEEVPCYRITYRKPGEDEVRATTYVRRRDGLVLQQEAGIAGFGFVIRRVAPK